MKHLYRFILIEVMAFAGWLLFEFNISSSADVNPRILVVHLSSITLLALMMFILSYSKKKLYGMPYIMAAGLAYNFSMLLMLLRNIPDNYTWTGSPMFIEMFFHQLVVTGPDMDIIFNTYNEPIHLLFLIFIPFVLNGLALVFLVFSEKKEVVVKQKPVKVKKPKKVKEETKEEIKEENGIKYKVIETPLPEVEEEEITEETTLEQEEQTQIEEETIEEPVIEEEPQLDEEPIIEEEQHIEEPQFEEEPVHEEESLVVEDIPEEVPTEEVVEEEVEEEPVVLETEETHVEEESLNEEQPLEEETQIEEETIEEPQEELQEPEEVQEEKVLEIAQALEETTEPEHLDSEVTLYVVKSHPKGGWSVMKEGGLKAIKKFKTHQEAHSYVKTLVVGDPTKEYIVYRKDGSVKDDSRDK